MLEQMQLARQPILNDAKEIFGYEFYYRNDDGSSSFESPRFATSSVLVSLLNQVGLQKSVGDAKAFINVSSDILLTDIIPTLPKDRFVFELSESIIITQKERDSLKKFHAAGYCFALDNATVNETYIDNFSSVFPYVTYVKIDTTKTDIELLINNLDLFKNMQLIAQKVEIPEVYEAYRDLGFTFFQGYFFAKPNIILHNRLDPKHLGIIRIFNQLLSDRPIEEISAEFEHHNELSMQLLQFLNSTLLLKDQDISSIRQSIEMVGKKKLLQWMLMIIYSKSGQDITTSKSPLSLLAQKRIDIMHSILEKIHPYEYDHEHLKEQARFTALLSLLESIFNVPMALILKTLNIDKTIEDALLYHSGELGHIYAIALSMEKNDYATSQVLLKAYDLTIKDLHKDAY